MSRYTAYGLTLDSEVELSGFPVATRGDTDVSIRFGSVPRAWLAPTERSWRARLDPARIEANVRRLARYWIRGRCIYAAPGCFLHSRRDTARFLIHDGREIRIARERAGSDFAIWGYLLSASLPILLLQRRVLTLHASAVATDGGAVVFMGTSGSGKSSLAAAMLARGHGLLADDVTAVIFDSGGQPLVPPAHPWINLWADTAAALDWSVQGLRRVSPELDKFYVPVGRLSHDSRPVRAIYHLVQREVAGVEIEPLRDMQKVEALASRVFGLAYLSALGLRPFSFDAVSAIASTVSLRRLALPRDRLDLHHVVDRVEEDLDRRLSPTV